VLVAAHILDRPTIREAREFIATLPPLSTALRRTSTPSDAARGVMPSYYNVNSLLLRMMAVGAVDLENEEGEHARRIVPLWTLEEALQDSLEYSLRDYLVWKPLIATALETMLDQIARRYSREEASTLRELLERATAEALSRWTKKLTDKARSPREPEPSES